MWTCSLSELGSNPPTKYPPTGGWIGVGVEVKIWAGGWRNERGLCHLTHPSSVRTRAP